MNELADKFASATLASIVNAIMKVLEGMLANVMGEEVLSMHPMRMDSSEEDGKLLAALCKA